MIEAHSKRLKNAIYRFLSRNESKLVLKATEEEALNEVVQVLKDQYEEDIKDAEGRGEDRDKEKEWSLLYPKFTLAAKMKAEKYKNMVGYKCLLAVPSFTLRLVMVSQLRQHYQWAAWFKVAILSSMLENHRAVSTSCIMTGHC